MLVTSNLIVALAEVRDALAAEAAVPVGDAEEEAERRVHETFAAFLELLHAQLAAGGLEVPLEQWDPRPYLFALEAALIADPDLIPAVAAELAAAAKTIRDELDHAGAELASLN